MRADRLLSILMLLQVQRRITARELARRLEVSERTIHRDMEALSMAGVPVTAERGNGGGWMLLEEYRTNLTGLNPDEIQALFVAQPLRLLADLGLDKASEAAFVKLLAALPSISRRDAEYVRQRIYIDSAGWRHSDEAFPLLSTIQDAIWQERKLELTYRRGEGNPVERLVDPLGLVAKGNIWYLVGQIDGEIRTYRVSRVNGANVTELPSIRPAEFDLASFWEQSSARFIANLPVYPATLRAPSVLVSRIRSMWRFARILSIGVPDPEGWVQLSVMFEVEEEACEYVLSLGPLVEVLEPEELREKVIRLAAGVVAFYAQKLDQSKQGDKG